MTTTVPPPRPLRPAHRRSPMTRLPPSPRLGHVLFHQPLARVGCLSYALLLHAWLFLMPFAHLLALPSARAHAHS